LESVRGTLRSCFAIALTKPVPSLKQIRASKERHGVPLSDTVYLHDQDKVRIVMCREDDIDCDRKKDIAILSFDVNTAIDNDLITKQFNARVCPFPGLEIEFIESKTGLTDLHVNLKFKKLLGSS
jgi:hypothetical protein